VDIYSSGPKSTLDFLHHTANSTKCVSSYPLAISISLTTRNSTHRLFRAAIAPERFDIKSSVMSVAGSIRLSQGPGYLLHRHHIATDESLSERVTEMRVCSPYRLSLWAFVCFIRSIVVLCGSLRWLALV